MNTTTIHDLPAAWRADPHANAESCARQLEEVLADSLDPLHLLQALCDRKDAKIASLTAERDEARAELAAMREAIKEALVALQGRVNSEGCSCEDEWPSPHIRARHSATCNATKAALAKLQPFTTPTP